jgi:thiamine-phosphate pyrophosphorylase
VRGYYFITDSSLSRAGNLSDVEKAVQAGVDVVQYRNKSGETGRMYTEAIVLRKLCTTAKLIINDRIDIALAVDADGVHIGQDDMPYDAARSILGDDKIIGVTVHDLKEAIAAVDMGADYLGVSPIFATDTKSDAGKPCGPDMIKQIRDAVKIPLVAVGGITLENAPQIVAAGADAICAISAVVTKVDVIAEIKKFNEIF